MNIARFVKCLYNNQIEFVLCERKTMWMFDGNDKSIHQISTIERYLLLFDLMGSLGVISLFDLSRTHFFEAIPDRCVCAQFWINIFNWAIRKNRANVCQLHICIGCNLYFS